MEVEQRQVLHLGLLLERNMDRDFRYDVLLCRSLKDSSVVASIAERLVADGLSVWLGHWEIIPGNNLAAKIEDALARFRVLVFCESVNTLGRDWLQLERAAPYVRERLNEADRRIIILKLDAISTNRMWAQFSCVDWLQDGHERKYANLLAACRKAAGKAAGKNAESLDIRDSLSRVRSCLSSTDWSCISLSPDFVNILAARQKMVMAWSLGRGGQSVSLNGHTASVRAVSWGSYGLTAASASDDKAIRVWDTKTGECLRILNGHAESVRSVAWNLDRGLILSGSADRTVRLWDALTGSCVAVLKGHFGIVNHVAWTHNDGGSKVVSGGTDGSVRVWEADTGRLLHVLGGHTDYIGSLICRRGAPQVISGCRDGTIRLWDLDAGQCLMILEGHTKGVWALAESHDGRFLVSVSSDKTLMVWDLKTGIRLEALHVRHGSMSQAGWSPDDTQVWALHRSGNSWMLWEGDYRARSQEKFVTEDFVQYTNAKVLLVGESGVGKTGLSKRLALDDWKPSDSTVGAWATQWKLPIAKGGDGFEREIWLWDFGGQADQRLIHQLYMDETALAVLVFDGQKEDLFETLGQWDRDLSRASRQPFSKLLVAGRVDAGGLRVSRAQVETFRKERGYLQLVETSAKTNVGCEELKRAILKGIRWENIPWRSSPLLFKRLKEEIVRLKDDGRVLMRFNELRETLRLRLSDRFSHFTDDELQAVVGLLAGPGVVWELKFGSWVLLQPERINAYAQAVIQTMREDDYERGCLPEERVLNGNLTYHSSTERLEADEERFVLLAMHQILLERGLCLREHTDRGALLVFPSYYRRERPELTGHPAILLSYRFNGFLDDIYATLVVRLHHTQPFRQDYLWRYAADFKTLMGRQLGVKLTRLSEGSGELEVYFDPAIPMEEKIIFSRYVHEHLLQTAQEVVRLRHYVCPHCGTPVGNPDVAMRKLGEGKKDIPCVNCDDPAKRIPLWDPLEELFASQELRQRVRELQEQSAIVLDSESKERILVGEVISTVALAGQICREKTVSDHGIDVEIEFKNDGSEATGKMVLLQLKSGDSYLRKRKGDGAEIFQIPDERHARYWMAQKFPVLLVIRNSKGQIRWMEVRDWLKRESDNGKKAVRQIVFEGERFDVMSVRRWRDRVLGQGS